MIEPVRLGMFRHEIEVGLTKGQVRQFPFFWVRIEAMGHDMPFVKGPVLTGSVEPIAKAIGGGAHEREELFWLLTEFGRGVFAEEHASEIMLDGEGECGLADM